MNVIDVSGLTKRFGDRTAVDNISLCVREREIVGFLGPNGSGKTTSIRILCGLLTPHSGEGTCLGYDVIRQTAAIKREVGYMTQRFSLWEDLTIRENLDFVARMYGMSGRREAVARAIERLGLQGADPAAIVRQGICHVPEGREVFPLLSVRENLLMGAYTRTDRDGVARDIELAFRYFPILKERERQEAGLLSGGQQQMLAIARALMSSPKLLLVDEPSVGLSPLLVSHTVTMIKTLKERYGLTVLMAEQNFHQAIRIADRGYIIVHGDIVFDGRSVDELEKNPLVKSYYLGTG